MKKSLKKFPESEKPREKALKLGISSLNDSELLAILLGNGTKNFNVLEIAQSLLIKFKNLRNLANASLVQLQDIKGVGKVKALEIKACLEIAKRFNRIELRPGDKINNSSQIFSHFHETLRDKKKEIFIAIYLDSKNQLIKEEVISIGSLNMSIVHPREVFCPAIKNNAESIILIHNHPSGDPVPSPEDIEVTNRLIKVGEIIGIRVLDHIIIGNGEYISLAEELICEF